MENTTTPMTETQLDAMFPRAARMIAFEKARKALRVIPRPEREWDTGCRACAGHGCQTCCPVDAT